uniref:ABC transporter substrate-binding protein n=1 Tax=Hungatella hathewayi TaxID=154046 RepID=UPI002A823F89
MKKRMKKITALLLVAVMGASLAACGSSGDKKSDGGSSDSGDKVTLKFTWWGSQSRHDYTQKMLDAYTEEHPNVEFEAVPAGWDGYFDKLSTQAASGSMPDIVQMDYLYITTYAKNNSLADLQPYIDDGTIDVSGIDENLLNTGKINDTMAGVVLSTSEVTIGYNPD